jgi:hypothetical protein
MGILPNYITKVKEKMRKIATKTQKNTDFYSYLEKLYLQLIYVNLQGYCRYNLHIISGENCKEFFQRKIPIGKEKEENARLFETLQLF